VLDTGGGLGSAVGLLGRGEGGELVGAALEVFGVVVVVVAAGRVLVELELDGAAVAVGRGRALVGAVADEVVGSADAGGLIDAALPPPVAVPPGDCLAAAPGVA
jgi:hypothetical protein